MSIVKYNNNSISDVTSGASLASGAMTLIKTLTASSSATLSFVHGTSDVVLDSTYPIYVFKFINCHPATDTQKFGVNFRDGDSNFDATKTTANFYAIHDNAASSNLAYDTGSDVAQGTGDAILNTVTGNANDESCSGTLYLFNPSSTTFVKHFMSQSHTVRGDSDGTIYNWFLSGYCNTTTAIDGVSFKFASGNIDSGTIKLYGIKDS